MASGVARAKKAGKDVRRRSPLLDHAVRTQEHYTRVNGSAQAGAITYFGFLSFFPILALAFFVVGKVAVVYPQAQDNLIHGIDQVLPGIVGSGEGEIKISTIESAATTVGILGLLGLLYTGLGWLSGMRTALQTVFELPRSEYPNFVVGKLRDLVLLVVVGAILMLSVAVTGVVVGFSDKILDFLGLGHELSWVVTLIGLALGVVANTLLFYAFFRLLAQPEAPRRALWHGALVGGVAFEILKQASSFLLSATRNQPAFQAFGIALILLVWINYFSRIVVYAASWAYTSAAARAAREAAAQPVSPDTLALRARVAASRSGVPGVPVPSDTRGGPPDLARAHGLDPRVAFGAGAVAALSLVAAVRRRRR
jgi:membrane protein